MLEKQNTTRKGDKMGGDSKDIDVKDFPIQDNFNSDDLYPTQEDENNEQIQNEND